jgi:hypothetical protein
MVPLLLTEGFYSWSTNGLLLSCCSIRERKLKNPINYAESVSENSFIHFKPKEKYNIKMGIVEDTRKYKGLG